MLQKEPGSWKTRVTSPQTKYFTSLVFRKFGVSLTLLVSFTTDFWFTFKGNKALLLEIVF